MYIESLQKKYKNKRRYEKKKFHVYIIVKESIKEKCDKNS